MIKDEDIIGFDFQGWPEYKTSWREIVEYFAKLEDGKYIIDASDSRLDKYPLVLRDDGMGYGIDERYIVCIDDRNIFAEPAIPNAPLWKDLNMRPFDEVQVSSITPGENEWLAITELIDKDTAKVVRYKAWDKMEEYVVPVNEIQYGKV